MNAQFLLFFGIFFLLYLAGNVYVGLRGWQAFRALPVFPGGRFYSLLMFFAGGVFFLERLAGDRIPLAASAGMAVAGGIWLAALFYLVIFCLIIDEIRLLDRWIPVIPASLRQSPALVGGVVVTLVVVILSFGTWNAGHTVWRHYDIEVDKAAGDLRELKIILVTDIHLGKIIRNGRLTELVDSINARRPDLVLLAGDIIDEDIGPFISENMAATFQRLQSRFGVFAVLGNHEYIGRQTETAVNLLRKSGIIVLRDSFVNVGERFVVAGREEWDRTRFGYGSRKPLADLLQGVDANKPLLLLDHQPRNLSEPAAAGVDLQVSGHTHRGQLFPNQWLTSSLYEIDHGYLRKGTLQVIVSAGFGTWGPPVRTSAASEIVEINVVFNPHAVR